MRSFIVKCTFLVLISISTKLKSIEANPVVRPFRNTDICGRYNNHRVYLELNEKGILKAENVTHFKTVSFLRSLIELCCTFYEGNEITSV